MTRRRNTRKAAEGISGQRGHPTGRAVASTSLREMRPTSTAPLELVGLFILLALIPLRTLIAETHTFEVLRLFRTIQAPQGAQPATTLFIVGLIVAVAVMVGCARLFSGGAAYRWTGAEPGGALLLIACIISITQASQKHLAIVGGLDFLGMVLYMLVLRQLLRERWHIRLVLIVILSTAAMVVAKCAYQHWVEIPETIQYYEAHQAELTGEDAQSPDAAPAGGLQYDYEQRLRSGTLTGYHGHPNILASHLILFLWTALAVFASRRKKARPAWALITPAVIVLATVVALAATRSKGAQVSCAIAAILWLGWEIFGVRGSLRPRRVVNGLLLAAMLGAGGFLTILHVRPDVFGRSIFFRTMYWRGAADMIADRGIWGVGPDNFGQHFTQYKPAACPEEVDSPHSWVVQFAAEWGLLGLIGILWLFLGVSFRLAGRKDPDPNRDRQGAAMPSIPKSDSQPRSLRGSIVLWAAGLGGLAIGGWMVILSDADPAYLSHAILLAAMPWVVVFVAGAVEEPHSASFLNDPLGPLLPALCVGLIGFLLHTGIDLALFSGAAATTFFALIAVVLAVRNNMPQGQLETHSYRRPRRRLAMAMAFGSPLVLVYYDAKIVRPAAEVAGDLRLGRNVTDAATWGAYTTSAAYSAYRQAIAADSYDTTALIELIEELIPRVRMVQDTDAVLKLVRTLQRRNPENAASYNHLCAVYRQRYELRKSEDPDAINDFRRSIDAYTIFVSHYPTSPNRHIYLANLLEEYATLTGDSTARAEASSHLQTALDLDAQRIYVSKPNRLSPAQIEQIQARINHLKRISH